jgi:predicted alpha/beta hydrolase family esterase
VVAHWAQTAGIQIVGALLVAVPDPDGPAFPAQASGFSPLPLTAFTFPSRVVASTDDPYASLPFSQATAAAWGSRFVNVGALGHINADSGISDWTHGKSLLDQVIAGDQE